MWRGHGFGRTGQDAWRNQRQDGRRHHRERPRSAAHISFSWMASEMWRRGHAAEFLARVHRFRAVCQECVPTECRAMILSRDFAHPTGIKKDHSGARAANHAKFQHRERITKQIFFVIDMYGIGPVTFVDSGSADEDGAPVQALLLSDRVDLLASFVQTSANFS